MQLDYQKLRNSTQQFLSSPASAPVWEEFENSVLFNLVGTMLMSVVGFVLLFTIIFTKLGFDILRGMFLSVVTLEVFRNQRKELQRHPEKIFPILAASIIVGPQGHGLILGTLDGKTQQDLALLARKAKELSALYIDGTSDSADQSLYAMLRDDTYHPQRRRQLPKSHAEGHELLLFDVEIDERKVILTDDECVWVVCVATENGVDEEGGPRGDIIQIPSAVAEPALSA